MDFQKNIVRWQYSMVNCQQLIPRLTTTFSEITQPLAIQNFLGMSFLDNFSQWKKLDTKNQRANPNEIKYLTVNHKITRKKLPRYSFILSINS